MIVIRHLTGPRAGGEDRPDPKLDRITFGRRTSCDVQYPPEETLVSREHFALVRKPPGPAGHWTIELFGEPYVAVNGVAAEPGDRVPQDAKFELGRRGGPSFSVHLVADAAADNMPVTVAQEHDPNAHLAAAQAGGAARLAKRLALVGLVAAVLSAAGLGYVHWFAPPPGLSEAMRARLLRAAFYVRAPVADGTESGTAFPIGPHTLATNSHVADLFTQVRAGEQMTVRSPGENGAIYHVVAAKMHPAYNAFLNFLQGDVLRRSAVDLVVPGYDVATLTVKEDLPQDAILELATSDQLHRLQPGIELYTAGYPAEGIAGAGALQYGATPQYHTGAVTGLTDFFFLPTDFAHAQLIQHSAPSAGGASGSPMVDASGRVIALLSAGNIYQPPGDDAARVSSGALINYAQRVDMLETLLAGNADGELAPDQVYWKKQFGTFSSGLDLLDHALEANFQQPDKHEAVKLVKISETAGAFKSETRIAKPGGGFQRQVTFDVPVTGNTDYVFVAYAPDGSDLQLWVYEGDKSVAQGKGKAFAPWVRYKPTADGKLSIWVIRPDDSEGDFTFQALRLESKTV
ncbi:MAG TPA: trypsin-like peptidase domain-containing protein [Stellaceae bacterium]|nr:trypsin-like peptidase domain-containing protein [Stellaceae bacterium]